VIFKVAVDAAAGACGGLLVDRINDVHEFATFGGQVEQVVAGADNMLGE
jgi:hypothetical protein